MGGAACGFRGGFGLGQNDPSVIQKGAAGGGQLDAARVAYQQLIADFGLELTDLPAQRRLGCMQPLLRCCLEPPSRRRPQSI
jgi:hypothetical protein